MNPADKRLSELIDKWLTSLELHLKYSTLDDASYWKVQPWVKHDRPSRWIIELARQKALQLKEQVDGRIAMGDAKFSDALELMGFLTNLVGSQHIARFVPLAEPQNEVELKSTGTGATSSAAIAIGDSTRLAALTTQPRQALVEATREMPRTQAVRQAAPAPDATREMPRPGPAHAPSAKHPARADARKAAGKKEARAAHPPKAEARPPDPERDGKVVADAVRLLGWGRQWHELPELISRMADRPALSEVRRILRDHKESIESQRGG